VNLSRVIDHIVAVGTGAVDLGALTDSSIYLLTVKKFIQLFEKLCGSRLTVSMTRVGGMAQDAPEGWFEDVLAFCDEMREGVDEISKLMLVIKFSFSELKVLSCFSASDAIAWGYTGPLLRASGVSLDLRKAQPYYGYDALILIFQ
jgi:NADH-quinone oxidoreductase subunit C/D